MGIYDHKKIEKKWQERWQQDALYETTDSVQGKKNFYSLVEYPYPSGNLHIGHWYAFSVPDIFARFKRMQGFNVLYPMGFDSFGLPAENAAIKEGANPRLWTEANIERMRLQLKQMGASFDWSREVSACDPAFYKWTQTLFLKLLEKGIGYRANAPVNWCPKDMTVLANEQVIDGKCERCDSVVEKKELTQWFLKITEYADRLIDDLEPLDWPHSIKEAQRNWIGRSQGAEIDFPLPDAGVTRVVILHGRGSSSQTAFIPQLKSVLENRGYVVEVPELPGTDEPNDDVQAEYVEKNHTLDSKTAIIGHSFGGVVALRLLERGHKLARVTLVATPISGTFKDGKARPSVSAAVQKGFDYEKIKNNAGGIVLLYDTTDNVVPVEDGSELAPLVDGYLLTKKGEKPHFMNEVEPDVELASAPAIRVFTTRPDTLYGATYLVLAPEHPWVTRAIDSQHDFLTNKKEVAAYVESAKRKSELERQQDQKEKTGVELQGIRAINPATKKEIPIYVADYVLGGYGTGAIMAVPAHDERDHEFATVFKLPITQVVAPYTYATGTETKRSDENIVYFDAATAIIKHWSEDKYYVVEFSDTLHGFVGGHVEGNETREETVRREVTEESGYSSIKHIDVIFEHAFSRGYKTRKSREEECHDRAFIVELADGTRIDITDIETKKGLWMTKDEILASPTILAHHKIFFQQYVSQSAYTGDGRLVNSEKFDGLTVEEAKKAITDYVGGRLTKTYKLRDWLVSRQRYWGAPIPVVYDPEGKPHPIPDEHLPWLLPTDVDFTPTGVPPLARSKELKERTEKIFGKGWTPDPDTLDTFVDSSWYFLRYLDPKNTSEFSSIDRQKQWMPVSRYSGGSEHTTVHVLYSRFLYKALYDLGLVTGSEPYTVRLNRGIILAEDGRKMSKRWGNVVNPDEQVENVGADAVRMYLAFIGPYNEIGSFPWNTNGLVGLRRFLERVHSLREKVSTDAPNDDELEVLLNQSIKKVGDDIESMKFNTSVSQLMILSNYLQKQSSISKRTFEILLTLLAPFAPHLAEELWEESGHTGSIHLIPWPQYDEAKLIGSTVIVAVQQNGKTKGTIAVPQGLTQDEVFMAVKNDKKLSVLAVESPKRVIYVQDKIINIIG